MHVHASTTVFVSRSGSAGNLPPVSTREAFAARCTPEGCIVPLGFCFGGFSSTAGYVPGNEAQHPRILSDIRTHLADHFQRALSVFIRITRKIRRSFQQAFRLRLRASTGSFNPLTLPSIGCVTASVPPPGVGQKARKQSDYVCHNTRINFEVK